MPGPTDPEGQIVSSVIVICNRYMEESDLTEEEVVQSVVAGLNEWLGDDVIEFSADT